MPGCHLRPVVDAGLVGGGCGGAVLPADGQGVEKCPLARLGHLPTGYRLAAAPSRRPSSNRAFAFL